MSDLPTPPDVPSPAPAEQPAASASAAGTRKRYSDGVEKKPKEPFAYQAAKIAFWAPFVGIALGYLSRLLNASAANAGDVAMQRDVTFIMVGLELFLMVLSILLGSVALLAIRKRGAKGLLVRPLIGVVISALVLGQTAYAINAMRHDPAVVMQRLAASMVGEWEVVASDNDPLKVSLSLKSDGSGNWKVATTPPLDIPSHWRLDLQKAQPQPVLILTMQFDKPIETPQRVEGVHWTVINITADELEVANVGKDGRPVKRMFRRMK